MSDDERQPATLPLRPDVWAADRLKSEVYRYHRKGWLNDLRRRGLLLTYQPAADWQADFEAWAARPVTK